MNYSKNKKVKIFGVPLDLGSKPLGVEMGLPPLDMPASMRRLGTITLILLMRGI